MSSYGQGNANPNIMKIGNYRLGKTLGTGSFGKVKVAQHERTGHTVAVKILNRKRIVSLRMDEKIRREIRLLKLFRHPHIIRLYEVIESPTDIFMVMEYVPRGELFDYIVSHGRLSETESRRFFQQIISGVEYCHKHMVVHRDLKPENLLLDSNLNVKIADFGLSNFMIDGEFLRTSCGSPNYAAPEVISGKLYAGQEVDVWSCGVILFAFLCARLPFDDEVVPKLFQKIREGIYTIPDHVSPQARDLIKQMLVVDPLKRITITEIRNHPWFQKSLPDYLQKPPTIDTHVKTLEEDVIEELTKRMGITRDKAIEDITAADEGTVNDTIVAYNLIYDSLKNHGSDKAKKDMLLHQNSLQEVNLSSSPAINLRDQKPFIGAGGLFSFQEPSMGSSYIENSLSEQKPTFLVQQNSHKWFLGLFSAMHPKQIFAEIMTILKKINFAWKITGAFQLRCRGVEDPTLAKMRLTIQLFKLSEKAYLIDFKLTSGGIFPFFDVIDRIMKEFPNLTFPTQTAFDNVQ
eukprot:TRINITY_DN11494_c0_g1_i1.p1 TRINITY_DN11494_c0_g1~~TRINITY_DN11494_c0_g1_i1.p1  ORF type:complete len:518 (+),score=160.23 TRINITY_DN11494_c0_g1_i1:96-1649(+)